MIQIGYTNDGKVWMMIFSTVEGKPVKTMFEWVPEMALQLADELKKTAEEAQKGRDYV